MNGCISATRATSRSFSRFYQIFASSAALLHVCGRDGHHHKGSWERTLAAAGYLGVVPLFLVVSCPISETRE
jgi:hypothetical protein